MKNPLVVYLVGVIALTAIGVAGLVVTECVRPGGADAGVVTQIIGLVGPSVIGLMVLIRSIANGQAVDAAKDQAAVNHRTLMQNTAMTAQTTATVAEIAKAAGVPAAGPAAVRDVLEGSLSRPDTITPPQ